MRSLVASIMMFTRLPLWRIIQVDKKYYKDVILYWPLIGFLTGATTFGTLYLFENLLPLLPACLLAVTARVWLTGALHEDGLADFFDGFGGGHDKASILNIMKDSHIGSYGTIGLILYFMLYTSCIYYLPIKYQAAIIIGADVCSKLITAYMINTLSYARTEESSKTKLLYNRFSIAQFLCIALPCLGILFYLGTPMWAALFSIAVSFFLRLYFKYKINGYTGDCCGASVLLTELTFYICSLTFYYS